MRTEVLIDRLVKRGLNRKQANRIIILCLTNGSLQQVSEARYFDESEMEGKICEDHILDVIYQDLPEGIVATSSISAVTAMRTVDVFRLIIAAASAELLIASPYIDDLDGHGVSLLAQPLRSANKRGVLVRLLTRETARGDAVRTAGISRLKQLVRRLEVRDYHSAIEGKHLAAVHAKLIQADDSAGYVGSAEVRRNALMANFEMGYLYHTSQAALDARQAFEKIWEIAKPVSLRNM